jgi:hypothetical protein
MPLTVCKDCGLIAPTDPDEFENSDAFQCESCWRKSFEAWRDTWTYETSAIMHHQFVLHPSIKNGWKKFCLIGLARQHEGNIAAVLNYHPSY